ADSQGEDVGPAGGLPIINEVELIRSTIDAARPSRQGVDPVWATHQHHARFQGPPIAPQSPLHCHAVLIQPEVGDPFLAHADSQIDASLLRAGRRNWLNDDLRWTALRYLRRFLGFLPATERVSQIE